MEGKVIQYARRMRCSMPGDGACEIERITTTKGGGDCMNFVSQCLYAGGLPSKTMGLSGTDCVAEAALAGAAWIAS